MTKFIGKWIEPEQERAYKEKFIGFAGMMQPDESFFTGAERLKPAQEIKKEFNLKMMPVKAVLYATAHGVYKAYINGNAVSDTRLAPETTRYDKLLYYQTYDITALIKEGDNVFNVTVADGWWIGRVGLAGDSCNYGDMLGFSGQLEFIYADGHKEIIASDKSFVSRESEIRYSDLYIGEKRDETFVPGPWKPCMEAEYDNSVLMAQPADPIRVIDEVNVKEYICTPEGDLVLDFGQVLTGVLNIEFSAEKGSEISLEHAEVLDINGNFKNNIIGRCKDQKDIIICGENTKSFCPEFTYHGFRYVRVNGLDKGRIKSAKALVIGTPVKKLASFVTDNDDINKLQSCIEWSTVTNMTGVPTDCPQREKLGWTGDIRVFGDTGCYLYDLRNILGNWLHQMRLDQYADGQIPVVIPNHPSQEMLQMEMSGSNSSSVWGDACVFIPLSLYHNFGDKAVLSENFEMMKKWMEYIAAASDAKPENWDSFTDEQKERNKYLWTKGFHFGDWLIPSLRERPDGVMLGVMETAQVVGACAYAIVTEGFIEVCRTLGEDALASEYEELLKKIRAAICAEFVAEDGRVNNSDLQGNYVMVLKAGACEGQLKEKALDYLVKLIKANKGCLDTGFSSVSHLLDVLYDNGRKDIAYKLLWQTEAPSWLYMVKMGATTIWENWKAVLPDGTTTDSSYNHYAFGCVGEWMYRHMGGIKALAPGFSAVRIEPDTDCGLKECSLNRSTEYGEISCSWKINGDHADICAVIPDGVTAELVINNETRKVSAGTYNYTV